MTNTNNLKPIENKKPVETVYELKNEIPSFEEFMKDYKTDENLNYADLNGSSVGEVKGYGPCKSCSGSNRSLKFELKIVLKNCMGGSRSRTSYNTGYALSEAEDILEESGCGEDDFGGVGCFSKENRRILANRIKEEVRRHRNGESIDETVSNDDMIDSRRREAGSRRQMEAAKELEEWFEVLDETLSQYPGGERHGRSFFLD